jgi:ATP-dependent Clp protease ATP-binding subunit ClpB
LSFELQNNPVAERRIEIQKELDENKSVSTLCLMDVCEVVSGITDIPKEKIAQSKQDNILNIKEKLEKRVFGQTQAIQKIADNLMSSFAGLSAEQKPLGSFLLLGPSGVGKTEIAKAVTEQLFDHEKNMIRLDLSEYSEKHSVSKLIGAPAGYAGYDEGGILTEAIRKNPYSVILFDEVEKAHPDFTDILLQILDDGRLTDNKGRTVHFNNTIIFLTSNLKDPGAYFKPEVLGRFNEVITFNSLTKEVMPKLVSKELKALNTKLKKQNIQVELTDEVVAQLSSEGFSEKFGARPLIRIFNQKVMKPLAQQILTGTLAEGIIQVLIQDSNIVIKNKNVSQ